MGHRSNDTVDVVGIVEQDVWRPLDQHQRCPSHCLFDSALRGANHVQTILIEFVLDGPKPKQGSNHIILTLKIDDFDGRFRQISEQFLWQFAARKKTTQAVRKMIVKYRPKFGDPDTISQVGPCRV